MPFSRRVAPAATVFLSALALASLSAPVRAVQLPGETVQKLSAPATYAVPAQQIVEVPLQADVTSNETPDAEFGTLSAAVAAQDADIDTDRQLQCLASAVYYESKGEPLEGQLAVAHVILNRTTSGRFAKSVCGVLTQRGQFSFVRGGKVPTPSDCAQWREAVAVAKVAQNELWDNPAPAALYFHARHVRTDWRATKVAALGNHVFYR